jgi:hypothetical protein
MRSLLGFPDPVNEKAARVVAGVVALTGVLALATGWYWLLAVLAYGFWARVLTGPRLSPLGRLAMAVAARWLGPPRHVPGPPKRFAQGMGAAMTTVGTLAVLGLGGELVAQVVLVALVIAATLESVFAFCIGCQVFAGLMRVGVIPDEVCERCANLGAGRA